jgi:SOS response regulatory protein OraA/RecX
MGRIRLLAELDARGVSSGDAGEVLDELYPEDDLELARRAARGFRGSPEALARRLDRLGFSGRAIVSVLRQMDDGAR